MRTVSEILIALYRPLSFGVRQEGQNFKNIRNFHEVVCNLLVEAKGLELAAADRHLIGALWEDFSGFETASDSEQSNRVKRAFARLQDVSEKSPTIEMKPPPSTSPSVLQQPVSVVHGVGKSLVQKLARKNIHTLEDAMFDLPLRYEDRSALLPISQIIPGKLVTVRGKVISAQVVQSFRQRKVLTVILQDQTGFVLAKWFHYHGKVPDKRFRTGTELIVSGNLTNYRGRLEMHHPEVEMLASDQGEEAEKSFLIEERIIPIYALTEGLNQRFYRHVQRRIAQTYASHVPDVLPDKVKQTYGLLDLSESIVRVHCPDKDTDLDLLNRHRSPAQKRIIFEELFFLALSIQLRKQKVSQLSAYPMPAPTQGEGSLTQRLRRQISFQLTQGQERVLRQIYEDLAHPLAMNRLLQGDVGSGKTIVALFSALRAIENGYQVAFMAPTEILAEQHFINWSRILPELGVSCFCLTSSTPKSKRAEILPQIESGQVQVILGTHALIEEEVRFERLGLVIVDEQHRFGVLQRVALRKKGVNPHALVMTATPIPRTLAMTVYGDLDLSILDELPPGRIPIKTQLYRYPQRETLYRLMSREMDLGHQIYIVYPLIEESETLDLKNAVSGFEELREKVFPKVHVGLLHGRMKTPEKEEVMAKFKSGEIQILVATTVIEVGIDVPNATLMVVENAERFGLSQLHQLRGRVGRGKRASLCVLVPSFKKTNEAKMRLKIMVETNDGFRIAEEDLRIRGPGEVLGTRQAGLPIFCYAELRRDQEIFDQAMELARHILLEDPHLEKSENELLRQALSQKWHGRLQLSRIG